MPRNRPEPKATNALGNPVSPLTGAPPVIRKTMPRTSTMVPSVVMNGLTLRAAMTRPLARPTSAPERTPAIAPAAIPASSITMLAMQPDNAAVEPTERSNPPPTITKVMPMAITAMTEDCTRRLVRLSGDRKCSLNSAAAAHRTTSEMSGICPEALHDGRSSSRRLLRAALAHQARQNARAWPRCGCRARRGQIRIAA